MFENFLGKYCIVRGKDSGVFFGKLESFKDNRVMLTDCRRIWYWSGAASLSELASEGPSKPLECKFPAPIDFQFVLDAIEVIPCTERAIDKIKGVPTWSAK